MARDWGAVQDAIRAWVKTASGLADGAVIWSHQDGPRPSRPFMTVRLTAITATGDDWVESLYDGDRPAGQEIEKRVTGTREITVSVQAYTGSSTGSSTATALLTKVQIALALPSIRAALNDAGIGVLSRGSVTDLSAVLEDKFEGRAALEARFTTTDDISEYIGYIETVEVTETTTSTTFMLPSD